MQPYRELFNPRIPSLTRANTLVLASLVLAVLIAHPPHLRQSVFLIIPLLFGLIGTADTARCMQRTWNFYHGGVILCIYMDLMVLTMLFFFLIYPYFYWFTTTR